MDYFLVFMITSIAVQNILINVSWHGCAKGFLDIEFPKCRIAGLQDVETTFIRCHILFQIGCTTFHSHQLFITGAVGLHPEQNMELPGFLIFADLIGIERYPIAFLVYILLNTNDVEHLLICFWATCFQYLFIWEMPVCVFMFIFLLT